MTRGSRRNERQDFGGHFGSLRARLPMVAVALVGLLGCGKIADGQQSAVDLTQQRRSAIQSSTPSTSRGSQFASFHAPAGNQPTTLATTIDGRSGAILPNGRFVTPAGTEVSVGAPKPFGLALSPDGQTAATINSGASRFSVTLVRGLRTAAPTTTFVPIDATFMGVVFSADGARFFASGGDNGNIWVGDTASGTIIGSVNLNGAAHPLDRPLAPATTPTLAFKGAFPGNMVLSRDGKLLYVVDQGSFQVFVIDTQAIVTGVDANGSVTEPDNFAAVVGHAATGRYPFGIGLSPDGRTLLVTNVGVFQYTHLRPAAPTGDRNADFPLCIPGVGYPDEVEQPKTIQIKKIDASDDQRLAGDACAIRRASAAATSRPIAPTRSRRSAAPTCPQSSSVYVMTPRRPEGAGAGARGRSRGRWSASPRTTSRPTAAATRTRWSRARTRSTFRTATTTRSPCSIPRSLRVRSKINLSVLAGADARLKGVQPVSLALDASERTLYVAEAGLNAVGVVNVDCDSPRVVGLIPTGWWPASVKLTGGRRVPGRLQRQGARRRAEPEQPGAQAHRDGHRAGDRAAARGPAARRRHPAGTAQQRPRRRSRQGRGRRRQERRRPRRRRPRRSATRRPIPTVAGVPSRADQARHLHQQRERHARSAPRRHHRHAPGRRRRRRSRVLAGADGVAQPSRAGAELHASATTSSSSRPCRPTATAG